MNRTLKKDPNERYASAAEISKDLKKYRDNLKAEELSMLTPLALLRIIRKPKAAGATAACLLALAAAGTWFYHRQSKVRWAKERALPEIQRLILSTELGYANLPKAYALLAMFFGVALGNVVRGVPLDASGYFFLPLWTDFGISGELGILDWYTVTTGLAAFMILVLHGALWVALKTDGPVEQRCRSLAIRAWWPTGALIVLITVLSFRVQPQFC